MTQKSTLEKLKEQYDKKMAKGETNPEFDNFYRIKEGMQLIRILPWKNDDKLFYAEDRIHYVDHDGERSVVTCLNHDGKYVKGRCPLCDVNRKAWSLHTDKVGKGNKVDSEFTPLIKKTRPNARVYVNALIRGAGEDGADILKMISFAERTFTKDIISKFFEEDCAGDHTDLKDGRDFKITGAKKGDWMEYTINLSMKAKPAGNPKEIAAYMESLHDIHSIAKVGDYDQVKNLAMAVMPSMFGVESKAASATESVDEEPPASDEEFLEKLKG